MYCPFTASHAVPFSFAPLSLLMEKAVTFLLFFSPFSHWQRESFLRSILPTVIIALVQGVSHQCLFDPCCHTSVITVIRTQSLLAPASLLMASTYHLTAAIASLIYHCSFWHDRTLVSRILDSKYISMCIHKTSWQRLPKAEVYILWWRTKKTNGKMRHTQIRTYYMC